MEIAVFEEKKCTPLKIFLSPIFFRKVLGVWNYQFIPALDKLMRIFKILVPISEENGLFMLGVIFYLANFWRLKSYF